MLRQGRKPHYSTIVIPTRAVELVSAEERAALGLQFQAEKDAKLYHDAVAESMRPGMSESPVERFIRKEKEKGQRP